MLETQRQFEDVTSRGAWNIVKAAQDEHDRWLSIYQRFGGRYIPKKFRPEYHVDFQPSLSPGYSLDDVNECVILRNDNVGMPNHVELFSGKDDEQRIKQQRVSDVFDLINTVIPTR